MRIFCQISNERLKKKMYRYIKIKIWKTIKNRCDIDENFCICVSIIFFKYSINLNDIHAWSINLFLMKKIFFNVQNVRVITFQT